MKQYMPLKPVKRGFKVWVREDAITGYFCDLEVYVGKTFRWYDHRSRSGGEGGFTVE